MAFALGDHFSSFGHAIGIAPGKFSVAVGVAFFAGFHPDRKRVTDFDGVKAEVVGEVDHLGDEAGIVIADVRAD